MRLPGRFVFNCAGKLISALLRAFACSPAASSLNRVYAFPISAWLFVLICRAEGKVPTYVRYLGKDQGRACHGIQAEKTARLKAAVPEVACLRRAREACV